MKKTLLPPAIVAAIADAARSEGRTRVLARVSWLESVADYEALQGTAFHFAPGRKAASIGCPDCVEVYAVNDWEIAADWQVWP